MKTDEMATSRGRWALGMVLGALLLFVLGAWLLSFMLLVLVAGLGVRRVPIGHQGVVTQLGGRTGRILREGPSWLPPLLQDVVLVNVRERSFATSEDAWTRDRIHLRFNVTLQYRVADPSAFLDVDSGAGSETPSGLAALLQQELRRLLSGGTSAELLGADAGRREHELKTRLRQDLATGALRRWGIELLEVFVSDLDVDEAAVRTALQAETVAEMHGLGEQQRIRSDVERLQILSDAALQLLPELSRAVGRAVPETEAVEYLRATHAALRAIDVDEMVAQRASLVAGFQRSRRHVPLLSDSVSHGDIG